MKVKRVDEVVIRMAPWEVDKLVREIENAIASHNRNAPHPYPLALHDFREELKGLL